MTTNPESGDTDGDTLPDSYELEAHSFTDNPEIADAYSFLIDQGLTTYYNLIADPNRADSDGDGVEDGDEVDAGTDPLVRNDQRLGIDGLELPASTLFQPVNYPKPAIPMSLQIHDVSGATRLVEQKWNTHPVVWGLDGSCVENCQALEDLAASRPNDNGWGICIGGFGDCVTDASQVRDIVKEAKAAQGIFTDDGAIRGEYAAEQSVLLCAEWSGDAQCCQDTFEHAYPNGFKHSITDDQLSGAVLATVIALPCPGVGISDVWARRIGYGILATSLVAVGVEVADIADSVRSCYKEIDLESYSVDKPYADPCDVAPTFSPGSDVLEAAEHKIDAIASGQEPVLTYEPEAVKSISRRWYNSVSPCDAAGRAAAQAARPGVDLACDEYPYFSTTAGGPGASLKMLSRTDNSSEGGRLTQFYRACTAVRGTASAGPAPYVVAPTVVAPSVWYCGGAD